MDMVPDGEMEQRVDRLGRRREHGIALCEGDGMVVDRGRTGNGGLVGRAAGVHR